MAKIICGISDIPLTIPHVPMTLSRREYNHPIFYLPQRKLLGLYTTYTKGHLSDIDSYLLFLALLKSTDAVEFVVPALITTSTPHIIAATIGQLVNVIWSTNAIRHPSFKQPRFFLRADTANLDNIKIWIASWQGNIDNFKQGINTESDIRKLKKVEDKLSKLIFTPEAGETRLASAVAEWADKAACFPTAKRDAWKLIIRKCYNLNAMFSTPKKDIIEIKCFCEENLEIGSIHYHTLMKTLRTGIANHNDFLGLGVFDSKDDSSYTLLTTDNTIEEAATLSLISKAPAEEPVETEFNGNKLAYLRAKMAYREAVKFNATKIANTSDIKGEL